MQIDIIETSSLGDRSYLVSADGTAAVVDPQRDIDRVLHLAAERGVEIAAVLETHLHNDYVTGGLDLARITGARYHVPADAAVAFAHVPVRDGDLVPLGEDLALRAVATPGHTPHHTAYVLVSGSRDVAVFTGGSLLIGTVGRPDLVEPRLTERLARAQHASARRLAELDPDVAVLPTHGFGSFCSSAQAQGEESTIGRERTANEALTLDVDEFVARLLADLDVVPAYYTHMGPLNAAGPAPIDLTPPAPADAAAIAARLAVGEWVVDLRSRVAFADGHVAGTVNVEADGNPATYLAWLMPWGRPVTLLGESEAQVAAAQRELARVGVDRPAAAASGSPSEWSVDGVLASYPLATFAELAGVAEGSVVVLDVRRDRERAAGYLAGSVHIPVHQVRERMGELPPGQVWVHCAAGMRAAIAASLLAGAGRDVVAVDDVFAAAESAGLRVLR